MDKRLAICLLTYGGHPARREYAYTTLRTTLENVRYNGPLYVHIADDGSPPEHRDCLREIALGFPQVQGVTISNGERGGYGHNWNVATQTLHMLADVVLPLEDDWQLQRTLDLDPLVRALDDGRVGCIRLGYLGCTQELRGSVLLLPTQSFLLFDQDSAEPHVWAGHPRIETIGWEREVGEWPQWADGGERILAPGETEFIVAHRPAARSRIGWPLDVPGLDTHGGLYAHIGSIQSTVVP